MCVLLNSCCLLDYNPWKFFLLDNIDLGLFNMPPSELPRVQCFEQKRFRQMIIMAYGMKHGKWGYVPGGVCFL